MSNVQALEDYRKDRQGNTYIPATQRADGTWRKEIKVKPGYIPQEEVLSYASSKKTQMAKENAKGPIGLSAQPVSSVASKKKKNKNKKPSAASAAASNTVDNHRERDSSADVEDITDEVENLTLEESGEWTQVKTKRRGAPPQAQAVRSSKAAAEQKKKSVAAAPEEPVGPSAAAKKKEEKKKAKAAAAAAAAPAPSTAEPEKRLRNLKKKLRDLDDLEKKIKTGEIAQPNEDQLAKIKRRKDYKAEYQALSKQLGKKWVKLLEWWIPNSLFKWVARFINFFALFILYLS